MVLLKKKNQLPSSSSSSSLSSSFLAAGIVFAFLDGAGFATSEMKVHNFGIRKTSKFFIIKTLT